MKEKLKIYFACSIRGEQGGLEEKALIVDTIKNLGHEVLSEIFVGQDINTNDLHTMIPPEICERDLNWIMRSNVIVADVTRANLGVGFEVGWVAALAHFGWPKRIVCLCHEERFESLSNMIKGFDGSKYSQALNGKFGLYQWRGLDHPEDVRNILEKELGKVV